MIEFSSFKNFVNSLIGFIESTIIPILITVAVLFFVYNVTMFIFRADDKAQREKMKQYMIWSVIALFLIFSLWGIIAILRNTVGVRNPLPLFPEGNTTSSSTAQ